MRGVTTRCRRFITQIGGVQYAVTEYTDLLEAHQVQISVAEVGEAWHNEYVERLIRTIKEKEVNLSEYEDYHDALEQLGRFLDEVYSQKRITRR